MEKNDEYVPLPDELVGRILHKAGLNATKGAGRSRALIAASRDGMGRIFRDHILMIDNIAMLISSNKTSQRFDKKSGQFQLKFGNYNLLMSLFEICGKDARKIFINYRNMDENIRRDINKNIVNKYAEYLTDLSIEILSDKGLWEEISNENGEIQFPNVKNFSYVCNKTLSDRKSFDLNAMFPKLENFKLIGSINNPNCLANVSNLKDLTVLPTYVLRHNFPEHLFEDIFAKNKGITKLNISPQKIETLQSIDKHLKRLETLQLKNPSRKFLTRNTGYQVCNLSSIATLIIDNNLDKELPGNPSFSMPNLKRLIIRGEYLTYQCTDFINHFENLEYAEIKPFYNVFECIGKLKHVKVFTFKLFCTQLAHLKEFFETFDETSSKLDTLNLECMEFAYHREKVDITEIEKIMNEMNNHLIGSNKSTWTVCNVEEQKGKWIDYVMIKRNL